MKSSKFIKNSSFSVLQTIITAIAALLLFKLMVLHAGLKLTGIWSYLSSITAITGFGCYGFANSLVFYIPRYKLQHDEKKLNSLINTSFFSVAGFTAILCILSYTIFSFIIPVTVESMYIKQAYQLLPFVVLSFFFSGLSSVYLSVLDGLLLMHLRAKINIAGAFIFLAAGYLLIREVGIIGIVLAQLLQNIFLFAAPFLVVKKNLRTYAFSFQFSSAVFKNIFRYGFNFQVISIAQIISDPFMKTMITKYAGSNYTAIFDFCVKLMSVSRSLLIAANQSIVPQITIFKTIGKQKRINVFYKANFKLVLFASIFLFLSPLALVDAISIFFLNKPDSGFNFILFSVALGLFANAIAFPAHFSYLGTGNLKWNVINNVIAAALILVFTPLVGEIVGGKYVVLCWSLSAVIGPSILINAIHKEMGISIFSFINNSILILVLAIVFAGIFNYYINKMPLINGSNFVMITIDVVVLIAFLLYPLFSNTMVKKIIRKISRHQKK